jgi:threonine aldolase
VSVCFSKGLGAPVGSALAGPKDLIRVARRHRKVLGGGMRQAGIIAAGALYALENHVDRLAEDHANAKLLAEAIRATEGLELQPPEIDTNMVIFRVDPALATAAQLVSDYRRPACWSSPLARPRFEPSTFGRDGGGAGLASIEDG